MSAMAAEKIPNQTEEFAHETEKALASLEAAKVLEDINFPSDFDQLNETAPAALTEMNEAIKQKMDEFTFDQAGNIRNENRFLVELLAQRRAVLEELLDKVSSVARAAEKFDQMDPV
jgi:hypothetical protein